MGNLGSRSRRVHTHACTHKHTRVSVCLRTERGVGKQWRTVGTKRPPPSSSHQPCVQFISALKKGAKGAPPTLHRGRQRWQGAGERGERTRAATAEKREAAPDWSAGNEPERWEGCALDPSGPRTQEPELRVATTQAPTRGAHRTSKHRLEMLKLGGLVRLGEKDPEAAGRRGRAGRRLPKPSSRGARTPPPTACSHCSPKGLGSARRHRTAL